MAEISDVMQTTEEKKLYDSILGALDKMKKEGVERVVLSICESKSEKDHPGGWQDINKKNYYPFEILNKDEQGMMLDEKSYTTISLVSEEVGGLVKYGKPGVEIFERTHVVPFLPKLVKESNINYLSKCSTWLGEDVKKFSEMASEQGWEAEDISKEMDLGIQKYHEKTKELMEKSGVYDSLKKLEEKLNF